MKKTMATIAALALVLALFAGCGNSKPVEEEEEVAKGSVLNLQREFGTLGSINMENVTLDDINMMDEFDPEVSQRTGSLLNKDTMQKASDN